MKKMLRITVTLIGSVAVLVTTLLLLERREAPDAAAAAISWGSGPPREGPPPEDMVVVPGGEFLIGDDWPDAAPDAPPRRVRLDSFQIDRHEVTNRQFERFVNATGHVTTAEREGGGWVYRGGERDWQWVRGADWRRPLGPGSSIESAMDHPVVLVSWRDADAFARWAGKRLPTEAEWEVAARAGIPPSFPAATVRHASAHADSHSAGHAAPHPSNDAAHIARHAPPAAAANTWQGTWPGRNELQDGYFYTAPVGSFPPNDIGLHDMIGNVWEWTADWYAAETPGAGKPAVNPTGPDAATLRVARGGSWFCSPNYCGAYRPGFRGKSPPGSAFNNVGFRCAADAAF